MKTRIESITVRFSRESEDITSIPGLTEKDKVTLNNELSMILNDRIQQLTLNLLGETGKEYEVSQVIKFDTDISKEEYRGLNIITMCATVYLLMKEKG